MPSTRITPNGPQCLWTGLSGRRYVYRIFDLPAKISAGSRGNFIYARPDASGGWVPIVIGHGALQDRPGGLSTDPEVPSGATHLHCHINLGWEDRLVEALDLKGRYEGLMPDLALPTVPGLDWLYS